MWSTKGFLLCSLSQRQADWISMGSEKNYQRWLQPMAFQLTCPCKRSHSGLPAPWESWRCLGIGRALIKSYKSIGHIVLSLIKPKCYDCPHRELCTVLHREKTTDHGSGALADRNMLTVFPTNHAECQIFQPTSPGQVIHIQSKVENNVVNPVQMPITECKSWKVEKYCKPVANVQPWEVSSLFLSRSWFSCLSKVLLHHSPG